MPCYDTTINTRNPMAESRRRGTGRVLMAKGSKRDKTTAFDRGYAVIERGTGARLRTLRGRADSEPFLSIFTCPTCGENTRLVMMEIDSPRPRFNHNNKKSAESSKPIPALLSITRRQVEQLLAEFKDHPSREGSTGNTAASAERAWSDMTRKAPMARLKRHQSTALRGLHGWKLREMFDEESDSSQTPPNPSHRVIGADDNLTRFCVQCGRVLAYRSARNRLWRSTPAAKGPCDWGC